MATHITQDSAVEKFADRAAFERFQRAATERYQHMMSGVDRPVLSIAMSECTKAKGAESVVATI